MTNLTGVRTTENILSARKVVDMAEKIALLDPNEAPFITVLKKAKQDTRKVYNPKFEWLEDDLMAIRTLVNGAHADTGATTIAVDDGSLFRAGDILKIPSTGEAMLVTAISTNNLTVVRAYGSTAAAAIADDAEALIIGNAQVENSTARTVKSTQEVNCYNYTQIFRTPISISGTENASKLYGGKDRAYQRRKAAIEHKRDIANALLFGQRKQDTSGSTPRRTMGGILEFLTTASRTQAFASGGTTLTYANFDSLVAQPVFAHGSTEKLLIAGPKLAAMINSWASAKVLTDISPDKTFGMRVKKLITSYGDLNVIYDPLLAESTVYAGYGFVLDMENVRYAYLDGRDTKLNIDIQNNDVDGVVDEYITECSLEFKSPKTHMLITGAYNPS